MEKRKRNEVAASQNKGNIDGQRLWYDIRRLVSAETREEIERTRWRSKSQFLQKRLKIDVRTLLDVEPDVIEMVSHGVGAGC